MLSFDKTMQFHVQDESVTIETEQIMKEVYAALKEQGYHPINQIVGYLLSGDPAYIPRHKDARNLIRKLERDDIIEELVRSYLAKNGVV